MAADSDRNVYIRESFASADFHQVKLEQISSFNRSQSTIVVYLVVTWTRCKLYPTGISDHLCNPYCTEKSLISYTSYMIRHSAPYSSGTSMCSGTILLLLLPRRHWPIVPVHSIPSLFLRSPVFTCVRLHLPPRGRWRLRGSRMMPETRSTHLGGIRGTWECRWGEGVVTWDAIRSWRSWSKNYNTLCALTSTLALHPSENIHISLTHPYFPFYRTHRSVVPKRQVQIVRQVVFGSECIFGLYQRRRAQRYVWSPKYL